MKLKKLIIFMLLFILSGCTVNYNLEIKDDNYIENINVKVNEEEKEIAKNQIPYIKSTIHNKIVYNSDFQENNVLYNHIYSFNEYQSSAIKVYFDNFKNFEEDGDYTLILSGFNAYNNFQQAADLYTFTIKTDYEVVTSNADYKKGNTHIWKVNSKNYNKKKIIFQYRKTKQQVDYSYYLITVLTTIVSVLILFFAILMYDKYRKNKE